MINLHFYCFIGYGLYISAGNPTESDDLDMFEDVLEEDELLFHEEGIEICVDDEFLSLEEGVPDEESIGDVNIDLPDYYFAE